MLTRIAEFVIGRPRAVLVAALLIVLAAGGFGAGVQSQLKPGGFTAESAESTRATRFLQEHFPGSSPNMVLLVSSASGADSPAAQTAGKQLVDRLRHRSDVVGVQSYFDGPGRGSLRSKDGRTGLVLVSLRGDDSQAQQEAGSITEELSGTANGITIRAGGTMVAFQEASDQTSKDLAIAEAVAIPLTVVALVLVFGSLVAAVLPAAIGLFAIAVTLGILRLFTVFTDVSVFALNMTTALGLALAVDYSLFLVSRYREERARTGDNRAAVIRAMQTAGRTVLFSALTVALALAALAVFEQFFLKSFAYAGLAVVAAAAAAAILVLPACLIVLGDRIDSLDLRVPLRRLLGGAPKVEAASADIADSRWYRTVVAMMRRAVPIAVLTTGVLVGLGSPILAVQFGYPDDRVLNTVGPGRIAGDMLRHDFDADMSAATTIALPDYRGDQAAIGRYAQALSEVSGVTGVFSADGGYVRGVRSTPPAPGMSSAAGAYLTVNTRPASSAEASSQQLAALRAVPAPGDTLFAGASALNRDSIDSILARIPVAGLVIGLATLIVLFLFTGSVLIPMKALVLNVLSLTASFGAMVWVFQEGHMSGLFGFTPTGYLNIAMLILMFCLAFGMSMDYEVFLLSRIREEWLASDRSREANTVAVASGVARTGRIYTAAAGLMAIVFAAMISSKVSFMQMFGLGMTLAVLVDAVVIRTALAPALMRMLSTANWWAPAPLAALHRRIGLSESAAPAVESERSEVVRA